MKDRSENRQQAKNEAAESLAAARKIDAEIVAGLLADRDRLDGQVKTLIAIQVSQQAQIAELQEANLRYRLQKIEWDESTAQLNRRMAAIQGENTKLRRRIAALEEQLQAANIPIAPEEEV